jgi:hypothetical protein
MSDQAATATISTSATFSASAKAHYASTRASISGTASIAASASEAVKLSAVPSTAGFAGINIDPTAYVNAAANFISAAVADASNGSLKARATIVMGPLPYVVIDGVAGSPLATRTGGTHNLLSQQTMIAAIGCTPNAYTALVWAAVANYLFHNTELLHADAFQTAETRTSDGISIVDMYPA